MLFLAVRDDAYPHCGQCGFDWRNFKHGNESLCFIILTVTMRPAVSALCLWVSCQLENFNFALPDGLLAKDFVNWHGFAPSRPAVMQLHQRDLDAGNVIRFIRHKV